MIKHNNEKKSIEKKVRKGDLPVSCGLVCVRGRIGARQ
jgi:hypothetical protein